MMARSRVRTNNNVSLPSILKEKLNPFEKAKISEETKSDALIIANSKIFFVLSFLIK